jgi:uncharacterized protein YecE (DUF72 family)
MIAREASRPTSARVRIGISGWRYAPWRGVFYPRGLRQSEELAYAARHFDSIELNGSFYSLQRPTSYAAWRDATPPGFVFAVKGSRYITHMKRLRDVGAACANFWASGVLGLEEKLGPILWQFPPGLAFDGRFEEFFASLPRTTTEAARLAAQHDVRVARPAFGSGEERPLRHAVEVRHRSFLSSSFVTLARRHSVGLVIADTAGKFPYFEDVTADFVYLRLHGDTKLYESGYSPEAIRHWAERVKAFAKGRTPPDAALVSSERARPMERDVYVYFDNDIKVRAPFDAHSLAEAVIDESSDGRSPLRSSATEAVRTTSSGSSYNRARPRR